MSREYTAESGERWWSGLYSFHLSVSMFVCYFVRSFVFLFDFCFTALQHILGDFGHVQLP